MHVFWFHLEKLAKHDRNPVSSTAYDQLGNIHLEDLEFQSDKGHVMT